MALWRLRPELIWIAILPICILVVTYRAYMAQWRHRDALDLLYDTAVRTQKQVEPQDALLVLVRRARQQLKAQTAELVAVANAASARDTAVETRATVVAVDSQALQEVRTTSVHDLPPDVRQRILAADGCDDALTADEVRDPLAVPVVRTHGAAATLRARGTALAPEQQARASGAAG